MRFSNLYNRLLPYWGRQLQFADGIVLEHKNAFRALGQLKGQQNTSAGTEHFYSESFSKSWQQAEDAIKKDDTLGKLLLWSMYQVYHRQAQKLFAEGTVTLNPADIPATDVEDQFIKNLNEPGYEDEKAAYAEIMG